MQEGQQGRSMKKAPRGRAYSCDACPKQFETPSKLARHYLTHTGQKPYQCLDCSKTFRQMVHLERHAMTHTLPFRCPICQRHFKDADLFHKHQQLHARGAQLTIRNPKKKRGPSLLLECSGCQRTFRSEEKRRRHRCSVVYISANGKCGSVVCTQCQKVFPSRSKLERHIMIHTGQKPYVCSLCGKAFRQKVHLTIHQLTHSREKPFRCHQCCHAFKTRPQLLRHRKVHAVMLSLHCSVGVSTSLSFPVKKEPEDLNVVPLQCRACDQCFDSQESMDSHACGVTQITTNKKDIVIKKSNCGPSISPASLYPPPVTEVTADPMKVEQEEAVPLKFGTMTHQQLGIPPNVLQTHPEQTWKPSRRRIRPSQLIIKNHSFTDNGPLQNTDGTFGGEDHGHVRNMLLFCQRSENIWVPRRHQVRKCDQCDKTFPSLSKLRRHYLIHTGQKPFPCIECGRTFRQSVHLKRHLMTHIEKVSLNRTHIAVRDYFPAFDQEKTPHLIQQHSTKPTENIQGLHDIGFVTPEIKVELEAPESPMVGQKPVAAKRPRVTLSRVRKSKSSQDRPLKKMRTRGVPRSYKCNVCNKTFLSPSKLDRHYLVHSGQRPFQCPECGRSFRQDPHLKRHLMTHIKISQVD